MSHPADIPDWILEGIRKDQEAVERYEDFDEYWCESCRRWLPRKSAHFCPGPDPSGAIYHDTGDEWERRYEEWERMEDRQRFDETGEVF